MKPSTQAGALPPEPARMKALVSLRYGAPEVVTFAEVAKPTPGAGEVRLRVRAAAVTTADSAARQGSPFLARLAFGLTKLRNPILGTEFSGVVEAVGAGVARFHPGDAVFAATGAAFGAHAEFVCLPESGALAAKPANFSHAQAAALCEGGLTALPFLRDEARLQPGQVIVINGASGCVGTAAVQLAKYLGARVIGVCGAGNLDLVRSLGADEVIDYAREDFAQRLGAYDVVFDAVGKRSFSECKGALTARGVFLSTVPALGVLFSSLWTRLFGQKTARLAFTGLRPPADKARDLDFLRGLAESGQLTPVIDSCLPWEQAAEAHRRVDSGHKHGSVILTLGDSAQ